MRSDFKPTHLEKANETLDKHLRAVKAHADTNEEYKKDVSSNFFLSVDNGILK